MYFNTVLWITNNVLWIINRVLWIINSVLWIINRILWIINRSLCILTGRFKVQNLKSFGSSCGRESPAVGVERKLEWSLRGWKIEEKVNQFWLKTWRRKTRRRKTWWVGLSKYCRVKKYLLFIYYKPWSTIL